MDKDNKYYELIENLVKQNRKFSGYEAILEDIIDDVYAHSQVIISSIDNENVIKAYLEKVITTSIITVSKKMNFNNNIKHRVVSNVSEIYSKPVIKQQEEVVEALPVPDSYESTLQFEDKTANDNIDIEKIGLDSDSDTTELPDIDVVFDNNIADNTYETDISNTEIIQKANPDLVDKMINSIDSEMVINIQNDDKSENQIGDPIPNELSVSTDELIEEENTSDSELSEIEDIENIHVEDDLQIETIENNIENINSNYEDNDNSVEMLDINEIDYNDSEDTGLESESADNDIETIDFTNVDESGSIDEHVNDTADLDSEIRIEAVSSSQSEELPESLYKEGLTGNSIEDSNIDLKEMEDVNYNFNIEEQASEEIKGESELTEDNSITLADDNSFMLDENLNDNIIAIPDTTEGFSDMLDENVESDEISEFEDIENNQNNLNIEPDISDNLSIDFNNSDISIEENSASQNNNADIAGMVIQTHKDIDYTAFNYIPEENKYISNINEISNKIIELDSNKPNLHILKIFDLKYKQNLTIEQIAEKLSVNKQEVVLALDALVDLI